MSLSTAGGLSVSEASVFFDEGDEKSFYLLVRGMARETMHTVADPPSGYR